MKEKSAILLIALAVIVVGCFLYWLIKKPARLKVGTILESSVKFTSNFNVVTILAIKNNDETMAYAYLDGAHNDLWGKHVEYQLSKLGWLDSKTEYYTEESVDDVGNKLIHNRVRDYIALTKGHIS